MDGHYIVEACHHVKLPEFIQTRQPDWDELSDLTAKAGRRASSLDASDIRRLAALYRTAATDLAIARRRYSGGPLVGQLEALVGRARAVVYGGRNRRNALSNFITNTYWQLIWERRRPLALATLLLFAPALLGVVWALGEPEVLAGVLPAEFLWVTEAESTDQGYSTAGLVGFSTFVLVNNIRVTLTAFVLGVTWGLGTGWILAQNGLIIGAVVGLALEAGNWRILLAAIVAHGLLEFSCILVGGAAGLSMGRAVLRPGSLTRRQALAVEARATVQLALGTALWLVLAGFVEGFASRTGLGWVPATATGTVIGGAFWVLVGLRGRQVVGSEPVEPLGAHVARD
jgi:uncharacterized membrane protein SpoIIM required for sporulation